MSFGSIALLEPWLLLGLFMLPILWLLLRAVPPAPLRRRFPAVSLLLDLEDKETTPYRTPWWLLLLRTAAIILMIFAFARPVFNPTDRVTSRSPLLIAMDGSWASAQSWGQRQDKLIEVLQFAMQDRRPVAIVLLSDRLREDNSLTFVNASEWLNKVDALTPNAWEPSYKNWIAASQTAEAFDTLWFSDGLARDGRDLLLAAFKDRGDVRVVQADDGVFALRGIEIEGGKLKTTALRVIGDAALKFKVQVEGPGPAGINRVLALAAGTFEEGMVKTQLSIELPSELRNRVERVVLDNVRSAGAVIVADDSFQRKKVALIGGGTEQEGAILVSPLHFLRKALIPMADVIETDLVNSLQANPDVIIFADVADMSSQENRAVLDWVESGGVLVRFAGPRLAASGIGQLTEHPLLPVRLRAGGRNVGGTMSWGLPKMLEAFPTSSPFFGLNVPTDVFVERQVMAQPDPKLSERVLALLVDGTPLVTAKDQGAGRVVLFHVTANAEWSSLPLSGLFVQMLERLAISSRLGSLAAAELEGMVWAPEQILDGFGFMRDAPTLAGVAGAKLASRVLASDMPPGIYANGERRVALNVLAKDRSLHAYKWPLGTTFLSLRRSEELPLQAWMLMAALVLLCLDILVTLFTSGRLWSRGAMVVLVAFLMQGQSLEAQNDSEILNAANNMVLAYVETGNSRLDDISHAGLLGLSAELFRRTSIEPIAPVGVNLETAELSLYPFLYWPLNETQNLPSEQAMDRVNTFLRGGGMVLFDTRDADLGQSFLGETPNGNRLQRIAQYLDVPALEPVPEDHVLTRTFYLLQDFPGRFANSRVWVEASKPDLEQLEGMPFRNLNDGVTPVVIGGNDWASAWAIGDSGRFMFPIGRGLQGERQREIAIRFGVNLIMYVLTGNYKSDQVHVPDLLDRLGQ